MPRYEFSEGTSNKFWQIDLSGTSFTTTYGKIGTSGQTTMKEFATAAAAKKEYDKLIAEKVKKGYQPVGGGSAADDDDDDDDDDAPPAKKSTKAAPAAQKATTAAKTAKAPAKTAAKPAAGNGDRSTPRYFEFSEGTSNKFWEIRMDGTSVRTRYGKIGTGGQQTLKDFPTDAAAIKEYDKLVNEKTKKGYQEQDRPDSDDDD